jgi:hypothetical protein
VASFSGYLSRMGFEWIIIASAPSLRIAPVVGAYLCLSGAGLLRKGEAGAFLSDLSDHPAAMHAVGGIAFFVGALLLSFHRHWATPAEIVVNLVAALWVFEGAGMLADPGRLRATLANPHFATRLKRAQWVSFPVGLYLLTVGAIGSPS